MSASRRSRLGPVSKTRLEKALAYLIASTRRTRRSLDLLTVARELEVARETLGDLKAVSRVLDVSTEMLREFASVAKLSEPVKQLIREGRLTSVDVAYRLNALPPAEQFVVASEYVNGLLTPNEVRDVVSFRKKHAKVPIGAVLRRVKATREIQTYVIRLPAPSDRSSLGGMRDRLAKLTGSRNVLSAVLEDSVAMFTISAEGQRRLMACARERRVSITKLVQLFVLPEGTSNVRP
ncbi:MAG: hypothetical protein FJ291_11065 [Planctomycetes bacterium]|nr:hypothetical protein [Planctomycetota bacterium]